MKILKNKTYKNMLDEIELQDKQIDKLRSEITKLNKTKKDEIDFLRSREIKLQNIEMLFKNQPVDLKELSKIVLSEATEEK